LKLARVHGNVVATIKAEGLARRKLLVVMDVEPRTMADRGEPYVAVDLVGSGEKEIVLVAQGSAARVAEAAGVIPTDAAIVGIVDTVQVHGETTFEKR
jgi:ethanolamine utilization protein EutN